LRYLTKGGPSRNIVLTTGGTGGHIIPAMKIASNLISEGRTVYFITDKRFKKYETLFLNKRFFFSPNFKIIITPIAPFSHSHSLLQFTKNLLLTIFKVFLTFLKARPKIIIGFGSYVSFIPLMIGLLTFRKIIIHEQNVILGKVNNFFAPLSNSVLLSFPDTAYIPKKLYKRIKTKLVTSGFPSFLPEGVWKRSHGKVIYDLATKEEITIMITGGGQGASFFSDVVPPAIIFLAKSFPYKTFKIYHQVRKGEIEKVLAIYQNSKISNIILDIKPIFPDIPSILLKADIAIIRGGAGSIIEVALSKVFPIIIPMPESSNNHQLKNAMVLINNNAGVMFNQADCTPQKIAMVLSRTINDILFYFPIVNNAFEIFKINPNQVFSNVILYNDLESLHLYD
jgi:UDP-N-acetylglucosamine--N-acetylmuramyl-(pentapeptide) pyrophosphoryl-undecaprenol N-acetylglucosamine transferase